MYTRAPLVGRCEHYRGQQKVHYSTSHHKTHIPGGNYEYFLLIYPSLVNLENLRCIRKADLIPSKVNFPLPKTVLFFYSSLRPFIAVFLYFCPRPLRLVFNITWPEYTLTITSQYKVTDRFRLYSVGLNIDSIYLNNFSVAAIWKPWLKNVKITRNMTLN